MDGAGAITQSLELAAERGGDITPHVYQALFAKQPELEALFCNDHDGAVRGEMLARLLEAVLDIIEDDYYGSALIRSLAVNHDGYMVEPAIFATFADALRDALKTLLGADFTAPMDKAWNGLVRHIHAISHEPFMAGAA